MLKWTTCLGSASLVLLHTQVTQHTLIMHHLSHLILVGAFLAGQTTANATPQRRSIAHATPLEDHNVFLKRQFAEDLADVDGLPTECIE